MIIQPKASGFQHELLQDMQYRQQTDSVSGSLGSGLRKESSDNASMSSLEEIKEVEPIIVHDNREDQSFEDIF